MYATEKDVRCDAAAGGGSDGVVCAAFQRFDCVRAPKRAGARRFTRDCVWEKKTRGESPRTNWVG